MSRSFKEVMAEYEPLGRKTLGEITQAEFDRAQELAVEAFAAIVDEADSDQTAGQAAPPHATEAEPGKG